MFKLDELRFQTYVDDPAGVVQAATRAIRTVLITVFLLIFRVLGFDFSWAKGQRGSMVEWIGGVFEIGDKKVTTTLTEERAKKLMEALKDVASAKGMVNRKAVLKAASVASAAASVVPRARPFVAHLWGAATDYQQSRSDRRPGTRRRPKDLFFFDSADTLCVGWPPFLAKSPSFDGNGR